MRPLTFIAILAAAFALPSMAAAQTGGPDANPEATPTPARAQQGWRVSVGAAAIARPEWEGADELSALVVPDIDVRWGDRFFASFRTGVGWNLIHEGVVRAGPLARLKFGRDEEDDGALRGLGDVETTFEAGGFVEIATRPVRAGLEVRQGIGGHEGLIVEASADLRFPLGENVFGAFGPRVRFVDDHYAQSFFGVTATQAAASGLPAYSPNGGYDRIGVGASVFWRAGPRTSLTVFAEAAQLQGDAADSPLVSRRGDDNQASFGLAAAYRLGR